MDVDREVGVTAAQLYLRNKGNAVWLKRKHSLKAHKNALWFTAGFLAANAMWIVAMCVIVNDIFADLPPGWAGF